MDNRLKTDRNRPLRRLLAVLFWLAVWQIASMIVGKDLILPGPYAVLKTLYILIKQGSFWLSILLTMFRIMLGFCLGVAAGCLLALGCCSSKILDTLLSPIVRIVRATPVASFIILAMLWMSKGGFDSGTGDQCNETGNETLLEPYLYSQSSIDELGIA